MRERTEAITVCFTRSEKKSITEAASREDRTVSNFIRRIVLRHIKADAPGPREEA